MISSWSVSKVVWGFLLYMAVVSIVSWSVYISIEWLTNWMKVIK